MFLTEKGPYGYSRGHRLLEITCLIVFFLQVGNIAWRLYCGVNNAATAVAMGMCLLAGYYIADLLSGLAHWAGDTLGTENTPLVGQSFIKPFRAHHDDPRDITRHDFIETNGNNSIVTTIGLIHVIWFLQSTPGPFFYYSACLTSASLWIFGTNQFHKWAHQEKVPGIVAWAQQAGIILGKAHHNVHHAPPRDTYYCITHGQLNPLLAKIGFFRGLEAAIAVVAPQWLYLDERTVPATNGKTNERKK
jgi:hypothetical protein